MSQSVFRSRSLLVCGSEFPLESQWASLLVFESGCSLAFRSVFLLVSRSASRLRCPLESVLEFLLEFQWKSLLVSESVFALGYWSEC